MDISVSLTLAAAPSPHYLILVVLDAAAQPRQPSWGLRSAVVAVDDDHRQLLVSPLADQAFFVGGVLHIRPGPEGGPARSARLPRARRRTTRRAAPLVQRGSRPRGFEVSLFQRHVLQVV